MRSRSVKQGAIALGVMVAALAAFRVVELHVTPRFDFQCALDRAIPFVPSSIFLYQSFLFFGIVVAALLTPEEFRDALWQLVVAVGIGLVCFVLLPAAVTRPDASQIADPFIRQRFIKLWRLDDAHNTFPSLHVAITWILVWAYRKHPLAWLAVAFGVAITVSTLTVKQHAVLDVAGGVALAALVRAFVPARAGQLTNVSMTELSPGRAIAALAMDWGLIALCFAAAIVAPSPAVYGVAAVLIARTQLALAVLMHESAHGLLFGDRRVNDQVGQFLTAAPLCVSLYSYRCGHLKHHQAPMVSDDPVAVVFQIADYPISRRRLAGRLLLDLSGISYFLTLGKFARGSYRDLFAGRRSRPGEWAAVLLSVVAIHGLMLGTLAWLGHPWLYLGLWSLPSLTLLQAMGRMRAIMEHAGYPPSEDQRKNARTIVRPSWQTFLFGPHGVHFHIEHHQDMRVPFYRLRQAHRRMAAAGLLPAGNLYRGYGAILREVTRPL